MKNFITLLGPAAGHEAVVVDPAWDAKAILRAVEEDGRRLTGIVLTHHHDDHINAVAPLLSIVDLPVYAQRREIEVADSFAPFASALEPVDPGSVILVGALEVVCLHTPGHTPGSQCVWCGGVVATGDTLFVNHCGRCDRAGGDAGQMYDSLHRVLGQLGGEVVVYPGHDYGDVPVSSMARERARNPYLLATNRDDFIALRSPRPSVR
jgi:hydroxyacylglutathione hydrolase